MHISAHHHLRPNPEMSYTIWVNLSEKHSSTATGASPGRARPTTAPRQQPAERWMLGREPQAPQPPRSPKAGSGPLCEDRPSGLGGGGPVGGVFCSLLLCKWQIKPGSARPPARSRRPNRPAAAGSGAGAAGRPAQGGRKVRKEDKNRGEEGGMEERKE